MTESPRLSRRAVLLGGAVSAFGVAWAGFAGIEAGVLPGTSRLRHLLVLDSPDGVLPDVSPGHRESGSLLSQRRQGRRCGWTIAYPGPVAEPLPVVVVLHGKGGDHRYAFGKDLGLDRFLVAGRPRFALASIDSGDGYWQRSDTGEDAGAMVVEEFVPLLAERGLRATRVGSRESRCGSTVAPTTGSIRPHMTTRRDATQDRLASSLPVVTGWATGGGWPRRN